jgi:hypothetical protein
MIRENLEHKWIDISTISVLPELTVKKAKETDEYIPQWAKANPTIRMSKVIITTED